MGKIIRFYVIRPKNTVEVWLINNKGLATGCRFVNVTKGHICPCNFENFGEAIKDMDKQVKEGKILKYIRLPDLISEPLKAEEVE